MEKGSRRPAGKPAAGRHPALGRGGSHPSQSEKSISSLQQLEEDNKELLLNVIRGKKRLTS